MERTPNATDEDPPAPVVKRPVGRPRMDPTETEATTRRLTARVTPYLARRILEEARRRGITPSRWLALLARDRIRGMDRAALETAAKNRRPQ